MVNIIFALILYFGIMTTNTNFISNKIDSLVDGYNAQISGLQSGDEIKEINGKKVINQEDINEQVSKSKGEKIKVLIKRDDNFLEYEIIPNEVKYKETGIYLKEGDSTKIVALQEESPAKKQGLEVNDVILNVNGEDVKDNVDKLIMLINENKESDLKILVQRHGEEKEFTIIPTEKSQYYLGVNLKLAENNFTNKIYYAFNSTMDFSFSIIDNLKQLFTGHISTDQLMGPVGISSVVSNTRWNKGLYLYDFINIFIFRCYKLTSFPTTRWRKNSNSINRMD